MKVVDATPDRMTIEDRPWFLWITLTLLGVTALLSALTGRTEDWGTTVLVALLGLGVLWSLWHFAPFQRLVFDRTDGTFTHEVHRLNGKQVWSTSLGDIRHAIAESDCSDSSRLERVTLLTANGRHPLEPGYSSTLKAPVIQAINDWLGDADQ